MISFAVQAVFWFTLLGFGGWYVWQTVVPTVKQFFVKPQGEAAVNGRQ